jgi:hypothetical protein
MALFRRKLHHPAAFCAAVPTTLVLEFQPKILKLGPSVHLASSACVGRCARWPKYVRPFCTMDQLKSWESVEAVDKWIHSRFWRYNIIRITSSSQSSWSTHRHPWTPTISVTTWLSITLFNQHSNFIQKEYQQRTTAPFHTSLLHSNTTSSNLASSGLLPRLQMVSCQLNGSESSP